MKRIILLGAGGHSRACSDVIRAEGLYEIAGVVVPEVEMELYRHNGNLLGSDRDLPRLLPSVDAAAIAFAPIRCFNSRISCFRLLQQLNANLPSIISPYSYCAPTSSVGIGSIIMHGAIINAYAIIGSDCVINSRALVEHDVTIGDHCHISTGALVNGSVSIGHSVFIGSGTIIKEGLSIGNNVLIGAGKVIRNNVASGTVCK